MTSRESSIQHPIARIHGLITELKDCTTGVDYDTKAIHSMLDDLENLLVMLCTINDRGTLSYKIDVYDAIADMISRELNAAGLKERVDADSDATGGRRNSDRGSNQGRGSGSQAGSSPTGDQSSKAVPGSQG